VFLKIFVLLTLFVSFINANEINILKLIENKQLQTGDILYIDSPEYFSTMFKNFTECKASTIGLIVINKEHDIMLLKSDIDEMRGAGGIRYVTLISYLNSYSEDIEVKIYRPLDISKLNVKRLRKMIESSKTLSIPYDLSFSYKNDKALTCVEMISKLYGDYMFDKSTREKRFYKVDYPCDILKNNFTVILDWNKYKPVKGCQI
jgi:hypothetical protein